MSDILENIDDNYIRTFLRINKLNSNIQKNDNSNNIKISNDNKCISLALSQEKETQFYFEQIFTEKESQKNIFDVIGKPLCYSVLEGFNSTIISYGKKNTGKTYTLLGKSIYNIQKQFENEEKDKNEIYYEFLNNRGILIFCLENIFNNLYLNNYYSDCSFNISISFIEVFDNNILDYFNIENLVNINDECEFNYDNLFKKRIFTDIDFTKLNVLSIDEAFFLLNKGQEMRDSLFNEINMQGIKGHLIITFYIDKINKETNQIFKSSFNFVELSSSNIINNKYNISINKSLETFSYIINQLSDNVKRDNILYSNSILTNILKDSLGGNSKTSIMVNISSNNNIVDSFNSISFSSKLKKILNNPKINEIISDNIDYSYYSDSLEKNENLKTQKNYLLNYLGNLNRNAIEKLIEKKDNNPNQKKKDKDKNDLKKLSKEIFEINSTITQIDKDITNKQKEKNINNNKLNKIFITLFNKNREIQKKKEELNTIQNEKIKIKKEINNFEKQNINLDSEILQKDILLKEKKLKNEEEINILDQQISMGKLQIDNKEKIINNLKDKYNNLLEENKSKYNIKNNLEKRKDNLLKEKNEKETKIDINKNEYNQYINKSENIEQKIIDKNTKFNDIQKNIEQYNEYENITIYHFTKYYDLNNKKEIQNNNKFYSIQKDIPQKEKELKQINKDIDEIYSKKNKIFEKQEKIKKQINDYEIKIKNVENENKNYEKQMNNLQEKISILTLNLNTQNNYKNNNFSINEDKNKDINSSILSFDLSSNNNSNNNNENDLFIFKKNFNLELEQTQKQQLNENQKRLLDIEKKENNSLKEKQKKINNEINKFRINQVKNNSFNNKEKTHNQYNLGTIEENIDIINKKEKIITNYESTLNTNYNILNNYLNEKISENENENNINGENKNISIHQFKNLFTKFIEKAKEIDDEFELVKKEFQDNGEEFRWTSKEIISTSLKNNPILKNYEELYEINDDNNNSIIENKKEEYNKRITMNDNKILNDPKNLSIYNNIYPKKRKVKDYIKIIPEYKNPKNGKKIDLDYNFDNEPIFNNKNNKELNTNKSFNDKENYNNYIHNTSNNKSIIRKDKSKNNSFLYKSPDKIPKNSKNYKYKSNINNFNKIHTNNGKNKIIINSLLKESRINKKKDE